MKFFETAGYKPAKSDANFIMVDLHRDSKAFKLECVKHKVAIGRQFPALPTHARVGVGTMAEMKKATEVFKTVLGGGFAQSRPRFFILPYARVPFMRAPRFRRSRSSHHSRPC